MTPRFHPLTIADIRAETPDAISVAFAVPPDLAPAYRFRAGQYLTLRTTLNNQELRRTYSICSGEDDGELRIAIRRLEGGTFSPWAMDTLKPGMTLEVMTPIGRFGTTIRPDAACSHIGRLHVAFAAGSGITPILSVLKTVLHREPAAASSFSTAAAPPATSCSVRHWKTSRTATWTACPCSTSSHASNRTSTC